MEQKDESRKVSVGGVKVDTTPNIPHRLNFVSCVKVLMAVDDISGRVLAKRINLSTATVSYYLSGTRPPSNRFLSALCSLWPGNSRWLTWNYKIDLIEGKKSDLERWIEGQLDELS